MVALKRTYLLIALLIFSLNLPSFLFEVSARSYIELHTSQINYAKIAQSVNITAIDNHLKFFTGLGSRRTATIGADVAASYIYNFFKSIGLSNVSYHTFPITLPVSYGANLTIIGDPSLQLEIYPMSSNLVAPVTTPGITAPILYVHNCDLRDLTDLNINGKILLVNYNTGWNWLNALRYGAKAVIFIEPEKILLSPPSLDVPYNFPRFWIRRKDAELLLNLLNSSHKDVHVQIMSKVLWEKRLGKNVYGIVEGEDTEQFLILSSRYDSASNVLTLEPGANEAVGISVLLELARFFTQHKPLYNIVFVAYSGHDQSLAGSRWFVQNLFFDRPPYEDRLNLPLFREPREEIVKKFLMVINLELTSFSPKVGVVNYDHYYTGHVNPAYPNPWDGLTETQTLKIYYYSKDLIKQIGEQISGIETRLKSLISVQSRGKPLYERLKEFPSAFPISDAAPVFSSPFMAITFVTYNYDQAIKIMHTPLDTYETINLKNIESQAISIFCYTYGMAGTENLRSLLWEITDPLSYGWDCVIHGRVAVYNITSNTYESLPNAIVVFGINSYNSPYVDYGTGPIYTLTDNNGSFTIPRTWGGGSITAFKIDETTGNVIYAPTDGRYRWSPPTLRVEDRDAGIIALFKCASVLLLDLVYPFSLRTTDLTCEILEHESNSPTIDFGSIVLSTFPHCSLAFIPPKEDIDIIVRTDVLGKIPMTLVRAINLDAGQQYVVTAPGLTYAKEFADITREFVKRIDEYDLQPSITQRYQELINLIADLEQAYIEKNYETVQSGGITAWREALGLYVDCRGIVNDACNTIPFFSIIMMPFVILFEALFISAQGRKKILSLVLTFVAFLLIDGMLHPGFFLASNSMMIVLGTNVIILTIPLLLIIFSIFLEATQRLAKMVKGIHYAEVGKGATIVLALSYGIKNVKKRKLRTGLVLITVVLIMMSSVLFSSLSVITTIQPQEQATKPLYNGILIKDDTWEPLSLLAVSYLKGRYGAEAKVLPRAWIYPMLTVNDYEINNYAYVGDKSYNFYGVLGVTPDEPWLIVSKGRKFIDSDVYACIIPDTMRNELSVSVGETVYMLGKNYTVIGIMNTEVMDNLVDLDAQMLPPWDQRIPLQWDMHAPARETLIIPFKTALQYGYRISSVALIPKDPNKAPTIGRTIFVNFDWLSVYYSLGGSTYLYSKTTSYISIGWQMQIIPIILTVLIILNVMLTNVHERLKEISIYACIGLSPLHVMAIFLAESILFGIVGSMMGYVLAIFTYRVILTSIAWSLPINYASSQVTLTVILGILMAIVSTIYPGYKASKMLTPSLERTWKIPAKPTEDKWEVPLPFVVADNNEALGISNYLYEFINLHSGEVENFRVSNITFTDEPNIKRLRFKAQLAPFEAGVSQETEVNMVLDEEGWHPHVLLNRLSGSRGMWIRLNRSFLDHIRKQFLMWSALPPEEKKKYMIKSDRSIEKYNGDEKKSDRKI